MSELGRPCILDDQKRSEICDLVSAGHSVAAVARLMGCNVKTIRRHALRDERFGRLLRAAEVAAQNDPLKLMRRAAGSSWRAAAWLLERTEPGRFAKQPTAACRPEDVDRSFTRIMDTALGHIQGETERRSMYQALAKVMEEETVQLFLPPAARRTSSNPFEGMHVDEQRIKDMLDSFSTNSDPSPAPASTPQPQSKGPTAGPGRPKNPRSPSATNPGQNTSPRK